jgi:hypothetical protein
MAIKAQASRTNPGSRHAIAPPAPDTLSLGPDDELVMVFFPKEAWDAVVALANDLHVPPAEALGAALKLLRARVDEETSHMR